MILKLNEEQQGLKLIQVNDGFVVVDTNKQQVMLNKWYYESDNCVPIYKFIKETLPDRYYLNEVLFSTLNLNLEGVPEIEEKEFGVSKYTQELSHQGKSIEAINGFKNGYKQAQQNLFTEEDLLDFSKWASSCGWMYNSNADCWYGRTTGCIRTDIEMLNDFKFLKQPKVGITFENDVPVKAIMI